MEKFYTKAEIAKEVGVPTHILTYWLGKWRIDETRRVAGVKIYDSQKASEIRKLVGTARAVNSFSVKCPDSNSEGDVLAGAD